MANASNEAPVKDKGPKGAPKKYTLEEEFLAQEFDPDKKYMFELAEQILPRQLPVIDAKLMQPIPHKPFPPYRNIVMTSQIIWRGQRRTIRYYDGCDSIFVDEQPKDKDTIAQYIEQTRLKKRAFIDGKFGVYGYERMLLLFLFASSFNIESPFRTKTADSIYRSCDNEKKATIESKRLDQIEQALDLAKAATKAKMMIHADYLGIPMRDFDSDNELTEKEIRTAYRLEASRDAKKFVESYGNKALEVKYYIKKALSQGLIDTSTNPNKALWKSSGREICDGSGIKSFAGWLDRLFEFSQLEEGEEFKVQLTALFD